MFSHLRRTKWRARHLPVHLPYRPHHIHGGCDTRELADRVGQFRVYHLRQDVYSIIEVNWNEVERDENRWNEMEQDGIRWNEMEQDGIRWNEMEQDGMRWNEMEHDGIRWNEMEQDGIRWNKME